MVLREKKIMTNRNKPIKEVPCPYCFLFTPEWRGRCIHCGRDLELENRRGAAAPKRNKSKAA